MAARKIPNDTKVFHYHNENPKNKHTVIYGSERCQLCGINFKWEE